MADHVEIIRSADGQFYWHRQAGNNEIVSTSGESYVNKAHALAIAQELNPGVEIVDLTNSE